jgi:hypothetical protein
MIVKSFSLLLMQQMSRQSQQFRRTNILGVEDRRVSIVLDPEIRLDVVTSLALIGCLKQGRNGVEDGLERVNNAVEKRRAKWRRG